MRAIDERLPDLVGGILLQRTETVDPADVNCSLPFDFGNSRTPFGYKGRYKVSPLHLALHKADNYDGNQGKKKRVWKSSEKYLGRDQNLTLTEEMSMVSSTLLLHFRINDNDDGERGSTCTVAGQCKDSSWYHISTLFGLT